MSHRLQRSLDDWNSDRFVSTLKQEICDLPPGTLPLQQATDQGGMVEDSNIAVSVLRSDVNGNRLETKVCIFFNEIVGGCNCHDDPVSANLQATVLVSIDRNDAATSFTLLDE